MFWEKISIQVKCVKGVYCARIGCWKHNPVIQNMHGIIRLKIQWKSVELSNLRSIWVPKSNFLHLLLLLAKAFSIYFTSRHLITWHLIVDANLFFFRKMRWSVTLVQTDCIRGIGPGFWEKAGLQSTCNLIRWAPCSSVLLQIPSLQWPSALKVKWTWL